MSFAIERQRLEALWALSAQRFDREADDHERAAKALRAQADLCRRRIQQSRECDERHT